MLKWNETTKKWDSIQPPPNVVRLAKKHLEPGYYILAEGSILQGGDKLFDYSFENRKNENGKRWMWRTTGGIGNRVGDLAAGYAYVYCRRQP